jgi:very-short-patch-repair endonuclease
MGLKFRRQVPLGRYIVDFLCYEARLIIELDGGQHGEKRQEQYDRQHTQWLEQQCYRVQRFWNHEVLQYLDDALEVIWGLCQIYRSIQDSNYPPSCPSPARGEGTL